MRLNTKVRYGLRTMVELARHAGTSGMFQKEVAERQGIPLKYLDKIIADLKAAQLIANVAGKRSGYVLARHATTISVYDIYKAFEGPLSIVQCASEADNCNKSEQCASRDFWTSMNSEMKLFMLHKTLGELVRHQDKLDAEATNLIDFQI